MKITKLKTTNIALHTPKDSRQWWNWQDPTPDNKESYPQQRELQYQQDKQGK